MPAAAAAAPRRGNAPAPGGGLAAQPPQAESRPAAEQRRVSGMRAQPRVRVRGEGAARLRSGRRTRGRRSRRSGFLGRGAAGDWPQRARMQMLMRVGSSCSEEGFGRGTPRAAETPPFVIDTDGCAPIARAAVRGKCAGRAWQRLHPRHVRIAFFRTLDPALWANKGPSSWVYAVVLGANAPVKIPLNSLLSWIFIQQLIYGRQ